MLLNCSQTSKKLNENAQAFLYMLIVTVFRLFIQKMGACFRFLIFFSETGYAKNNQTLQGVFTSFGDGTTPWVRCW